MTPKPIWLNEIEKNAFIESNCLRCFQPDEALKRITDAGPGCPHLARAENNKMPNAWTRRRNAVMGETYRCSDFQKQPAVNRRGKADVDIEPMLDIAPAERHLVPVEGWPDWAAEGRKQKGGDHA
jgi:hypothetical protein